MVRTVNCGCANCGNGLGAVVSLEDPVALTQAITRLHLGFQSTLQKMPSGNAYLADRARSIQSWFNNTHADMSRKDYYNARIKVNTLERMVPDFARSVADATMGGSQALEQAKAGSSVVDQVLATFGVVPSSSGVGPPGSIYRPESGTADAFEFGGWALALAAGAAGILVLSLLLRR